MSRNPSAGRPEAPDKNRGTAATVKRYWPGRAPDWVKDSAEGEQLDDLEEVQEEANRTAFVAPVVLKPASDPRLRRLAERQREAAEESDDSDDGRDRRRAASRRHASIAAQADEAAASGDESREDESGSEEAADERDEDDIAARRAAVKARLKQQQEEEVLPEAGVEAEEDEESSEYETDSEEDETYGRQLLKPQFVPKAERETIKERELLEKEEEESYDRQQQRLALRKVETRELVVERLRLDEATAAAGNAGPVGASDIDTDDELGEEAEYEAWKNRELGRIGRDREEREKEARETAERERLKNMTDEERRQWERENPKDGDFKEKSKWKFMQKYWHKGAYYQTGADDQFQEANVDEIFKRDFSGATGEDKFDRSILPKVMQVKNFGRRGRTKYTHLVDQDTTAFDDPLAPDAGVARKFASKMAGTEQIFEKPKTYKT